ncbi:transposase [Brevibacillus choshinensis]|uniref:transposase n=1 Tax=Brevibacillus choshinensis TaxID=54911 RepID=UPI002E1C76CF
MLSSVKSGLTGTNSDIDKRSCGNKRRKEGLLSAPHVVPELLNRAIASGVSAAYVLMDNWFTHAPLIGQIVNRGLHVIGIVKNDRMASHSLTLDNMGKCCSDNCLIKARGL